MWSCLSLKPESLGYDEDVIAEFRLNDLEKRVAVKLNEDEEGLFDFAWVSSREEENGKLTLLFFNLDEVEEYFGFNFSRFEGHFKENTNISESGAIEKCTEDQVALLASITVEAMRIEVHTRKMDQYIDYVTPAPKNGGATVTHINQFTASSKNDPNPT